MDRRLAVTRVGATLAAALGLALGACTADEAEICRAPEGSSATCAQACARLFELECRIGDSAADCERLCEGRSAGLDFATRGRVLACYVGASDCVQVDGCSRTCAPGGGPVPFGVDGGPAAPDAGPACTDDALEEDDDLAGATPVGLPSATDATACPSDDDHFSFGLATGAGVTASATFGAGNLELALLGSSGAVLASSGPGPSPRSVTHTAASDDTVFVRVSAAASATDYRLDLTSP